MKFVVSPLLLAMASTTSARITTPTIPITTPLCAGPPNVPSPNTYTNNPQCSNIGAYPLIRTTCPGTGGTLLLGACNDIPVTITCTGNNYASITAPSYVIVNMKGGNSPKGGWYPGPGGTATYSVPSLTQSGVPQDISHIDICTNNACCHPGGGLTGEPHIQSWAGEWFDYMGECDLNLMHIPKFDGVQDLDVHARTTIQFDFSYIEAAALRIGDDILEVTSWGDYAVNGVEGARVNTYEVDDYDHIRTNHLIETIGGYPIYHTQMSKKKHVFDIILGDGQNITINNMKTFVNVLTHHVDPNKFFHVQGLLGNYYGQMVARDGVTDLSHNMTAHGLEWQVRPDIDPMLFRALREPQFPQQCRMPDADAKERRRLEEGVTVTEAEEACAHLKDTPQAFDACVYDVTATNDLDMADSGAY